jgi:PTS system nitrogen regulatory IIA component
MDIKSILSPDCVYNAVEASSKKKLLQVLSHLAAQQFDDETIEIENIEYEIFDAFQAREKLGSTGIGQGIALPHGRFKNCNKALTFLLTTEKPIDYDAIDNRPVKIFFALLVPEDKSDEHLKSLCVIAEKLSDKNVIKKIKQATNNAELFDAITE